MNLEAAFNMLVKIARSQKLTWDEHQRVTIAIETVLEALNQNTDATEIRHLNEENDEKKEEK